MVIILSAMGMGACGPRTSVPQPIVSEAGVPTKTFTATPVPRPALSEVEGEVEGLTPTLTPMPTAISTSPQAAVDFDPLVSCRYIQDWRRTY
jgi:hypothetical protein